jgi:hypothetical protein
MLARGRFHGACWGELAYLGGDLCEILDGDGLEGC